VGTGQPEEQRRGFPRRARIGASVAASVVGVLSLLLAGCAENELGRFTGYQPDQYVISNPKRIRNAIVKSEDYWIQKEVQPEEQFPGPTPTDLRKPEKDYILGSGDLIDVTVFELMAPGQPYVARQRITQTGHIAFPYLGTVKAAGLTTRGLEEKLSDMLEPDYIVSPQVQVFVAEYRNLNVSILNGIMRPGVYPMNREDMKLLELVAMSGGILQLVEDYGYVIREYTPDEADLLMLEAGLGPTEGEAPAKAQEKGAPEGGEKPAPKAGEKAAPEIAPKAPAAAPAPETAPKPPAAAPAPANPAAAPAAKPAADASNKQSRELLEKMAAGEMPQIGKIEAAEAAVKPPAQAGKAPAAGAKAADPPAAMSVAAVPPKDEKELGRWIWSDGKWVEVKEKTPAEGKKPPEGAKPPEPAKVVEGAKPPETAKLAQTPTGPAASEPARLELEKKLRRLGVVQGSGQLKRIIRFDVRALQSGDPTQNVVLRDGDIITIPSAQIGDFYMAGEIARPGVYSLTGRKITLLQAVAAAGGTTAVAVPWRTEVVRRVSEGEEDIIYCDIGKISRGEVPDFYVQPEDLIRVGTDQGAVFNAVIRNAFRATYGLGFVYDMNFADFYPWIAARKPIF